MDHDKEWNQDTDGNWQLSPQWQNALKLSARLNAVKVRYRLRSHLLLAVAVVLPIVQFFAVVWTSTMLKRSIAETTRTQQQLKRAEADIEALEHGCR